MTKEEQFLKHITYSTKESSMQIWFDDKLLDDISFEGVEHLLEDYKKCSELVEEISLQSLEYEKYEQNNKFYSEEDIGND